MIKFSYPKVLIKKFKGVSMGLRNFNRSVSSWLTVKAQQDANLDSFIAGSEGTYPDTESCSIIHRRLAIIGIFLHPQLAACKIKKLENFPVSPIKGQTILHLWLLNMSLRFI